MRTSLLALLLCACHCFSMATDKVQLSAAPQWLFPIHPDLNKKPVTKNISNGYYLELVDQQVNLVTNTRYVHYIRNIVNETGVQNASEVSVTFSPQYQQVLFHTVSLIRNGKTISKLNRGQIRVVDEEAEASDFLYYGQKRAFVILKNVQKNDRIEFSYSVIGFNPVFNNKYSDKIYFSSSTAMCNYFETIIAPESRNLIYKSFNNAPIPVEEYRDNLRIYHWSNPVTTIWESQPGVPAWFDNYPYVSITEYKNWQEVINWGVDLFDHYEHSLPEGLKNKIIQWRKIANGDKDQFAILAIRYVQDQIRYLGLEMGVNTHKPHSPEEVFQHSYGDCKDKSLLLAMILQSEKIPAYVAMINTTKKQTMVETSPSPGEFDHAIVAIERSSGYIYVDPTVSHQRGELINLFITDYGYALVIREGESKLQPVEADNFNASHIDEKLEVNFSDSSRLEVTTRYQGGKADAIRARLSGMSMTELEENYLQYYTKSYDDIQHAESISVKDDSLKNELTVKESYAIPQLWFQNAEGKEAFEIFAKAIYDILPDPADMMKNAPMALNFPSTTYYTLSIVMPELWQFPLKDLHIKNSSYQFDYSPQISGRVITLKYTFKTLKDHVPANELSEYKAAYKKIVGKLSFELYRSTPSVQPVNPFGPSLNWSLIWFSFALLAGLSFLFRFLNNRSVEVANSGGSGWPIGSWLVLLGISLAIACIVQLLDIVSNNFFDHSTWVALGEAGGIPLQSIFILELALELTWISASVACFYWFITRRDIFPRMFIAYVGSILIGQVLLLILYSFIPYPSSYGNLPVAMGAQLFRTCIYGVIWITYVLKSERVKSTFVNGA